MTMQQQTALSVARPFWALAWIESNNKRRDYGDPNEVRNSLAFYGWMSDNPVPGVSDPASNGALTDSELRAELAARENEWDRLKKAAASQATAQTTAELKVFELLYCVPDGDNLKLGVPDTSMNAGFRRARNYRASQVQRFLNSKGEYTETDVRVMIPVRPAFYKTRSDRIIDQQLENEMQGKGTKKMDDIEKLITTKELFDDGCLEVKVRKLYSSSTGQKTFGICKANDNWPTLKLYDRFLIIDQANPDRIPWGPIRGADLVKFNARFEADRKRTAGLPLNNDEKALEPIKLDEVVNYINDKVNSVRGGTGNAPKIMPKPEIEGLKNHKVLAVREVVDSVLGNMTGNLTPLVEHADAMNGVVELIKADPKSMVIDNVVQAVKSHSAIMADVAELLKNGKAEQLAAAIAAIKNPPPAPPAPPAAKPNGNKGKGK